MAIVRAPHAFVWVMLAARATTDFRVRDGDIPALPPDCRVTRAGLRTRRGRTGTVRGFRAWESRRTHRDRRGLHIASRSLASVPARDHCPCDLPTQSEYECAAMPH